MKKEIKNLLKKIKDKNINKNHVIVKLCEENIRLKEELQDANSNQDEFLNQAAKYKKLFNNEHKEFSLYQVRKELEISKLEKELKKLKRENKKLSGEKND